MSIVSTAVRAVIYGSGNRGAAPAPPATSSWDISTASFPAPSFVTSPALNEEFSPATVTFGDSGSKMYITGNGDDVFQYTVSTPYDATTAVYASKLYNHSADQTSAHGLAFDPTGTRMYIVGASGSFVSEYILTTAWDVGGTVTHNVNAPVTSSNFTALHFTADGLTLYILGITGLVYKYSLGVAWQASSINATPITTTNLSAIDDNPYGITISPDGTKMHIVGDEFNKLFQYTLGTAFDVDTATLELEADTSGNDSFMQDVLFDPAGTTMYLMGSSSNIVYQYTLPVAYDISTLVGQEIVYAGDSQPQGVTFSPDGVYMFTAGATTDSVIRYTLSPAWDIVSASSPISKNIASEDGTIQGVVFNPTGTLMYIIGNINDTVHQYDLSVAWDVTSAIADVGNTLLVSGEDADPRGLFIGDNGSKLYMIGNTNKTVYEYTLDTPYDVGSVTAPAVSYSVVTEIVNFASDIYFKPDGSAMYVTRYNAPASIFQYTLATPWDLSGTVTYANKTYDASGEETIPTGITMRPNGLEMFLVGSSSDRVRKYDIDPV